MLSSLGLLGLVVCRVTLIRRTSDRMSGLLPLMLMPLHRGDRLVMIRLSMQIELGLLCRASCSLLTDLCNEHTRQGGQGTLPGCQVMGHATTSGLGSNSLVPAMKGALKQASAVMLWAWCMAFVNFFQHTLSGNTALFAGPQNKQQKASSVTLALVNCR